MAISSSNDLNLHRLVGRIPPYPSYIHERLSEWPDIAGDIGPSDQKMVALFQVDNTSSEHCSLTCTTSSGTYSVDWGDGTSSTGIASNTRADHTYTYADTDLTNTSYGYKIAKIVVTPDSANIATLNFAVKNSTNQPSSNILMKWLDIDIRFPSMTTITIQSGSVYRNNLQKFRLRASNITSVSFSGCALLEYAEEISSSSALTAVTTMFSNCYSLQAAPPVLDISATNFDSMFSNCCSLRWLPPVLNMSSATSANNMFNNCTSLTRLPDVLDVSGCVSLSNMFNKCTSLTKLPDVFDISSAFSAAIFTGCSALSSLPATLDFSSATGVGNVFSGCSALSSLPATLDFSSVTGVNANIFLNCYGITSVPSLDISTITNPSAMFSDCYNLREVGDLDFSSATNLANIFARCYNLERIGTLTMPASNTVSTTTMYTSCRKLLEIPAGQKFYQTSGTLTFTECYSLERIPSATWGTLFSIVISNCKFGAAALDEIYTSLPTVTSKTITVTGNPGTTGDTPSIATGKGWTVIG